MNKKLKESVQILRDYIKENPEAIQAKDVDLSSLSEDELKQLQAKQERISSQLVSYNKKGEPE